MPGLWIALDACAWYACGKCTESRDLDPASALQMLRDSLQDCIHCESHVFRCQANWVPANAQYEFAARYTTICPFQDIALVQSQLSSWETILSNCAACVSRSIEIVRINDAWHVDSIGFRDAIDELTRHQRLDVPRAFNSRNCVRGRAAFPEMAGSYLTCLDSVLGARDNNATVYAEIPKARSFRRRNEFPSE